MVLKYFAVSQRVHDALCPVTTQRCITEPNGVPHQKGIFIIFERCFRIEAQ